MIELNPGQIVRDRSHGHTQTHTQTPTGQSAPVQLSFDSMFLRSSSCPLPRLYSDFLSLSPLLIPCPLIYSFFLFFPSFYPPFFLLSSLPPPPPLLVSIFSSLPFTSLSLSSSLLSRVMYTVWCLRLPLLWRCVMPLYLQK